MEDIPCPNCGYRRKRYLMSSDPSAPGLVGLLKGEGDPHMRSIALVGIIVISALVLAQVMVWLHI